MPNSQTHPLSWIKIDPSNPHAHVVDLRCDIDEMSPIDAAIMTVRHVAANYPAPYTLMLSGGVDSQATLYAWHLSGVPFNTRSVRYQGYNDYDLEQIDKLAKRLGISINFHDFDLLTFLEKEYDSWARMSECSSPQICTHMKMCHDIDGTIVFSGNYADREYAPLNYTILGLMRYAKRSGKSIVPFFLMETPELAFSFLPFCDALPSDVNVYDKKCLVYQEAGFPVIPQDEKYTGFERVKEYYDEHFSNKVDAMTKLKYARKASRRTFDLLLRYPYEDLFGNPRYVFDTNWVNHLHSRGSR